MNFYFRNNPILLLNCLFNSLFDIRYDVKDDSKTLTIVTSQSRILKLYEIRINGNLLWPSPICFNLSLQILR